MLAQLLQEDLPVPVRVAAPGELELGVQRGDADVEGVLQDGGEVPLHGLRQARQEGGAVGGGGLGEVLPQAQDAGQGQADGDVSVRLPVPVDHVPGLGEGLQRVDQLPQLSPLLVAQRQLPSPAQLLQELHRVQQLTEDLWVDGAQ